MEHIIVSDIVQRDLLYELAALGQLPLTSLPPLRSGPAPVPRGSNKRAREDEHAQAEMKLAHHPPSDHGTYLPAAPEPAAAPHMAALPTYTAELGRLPVFHQYAESGSSWYPLGAPLGYPDFAVDAGLANAFDAEAFATAGEEYTYAAGFGVGADEMSSDAMAMWVNAPTGFQ